MHAICIWKHTPQKLHNNHHRAFPHSKLRAGCPPCPWPPWPLANAGGINISAAATPAIREILCNICSPPFFRGRLMSTLNLRLNFSPGDNSSSDPGACCQRALARNPKLHATRRRAGGAGSDESWSVDAGGRSSWQRSGRPSQRCNGTRPRTVQRGQRAKRIVRGRSGIPGQRAQALCAN